MLNYALMGRSNEAIKPILYIVDTFYFSSSVIASYLWYIFCLEKLGFRSDKRHIVRHIMGIPIILFVIIASLSPLLGWIFTIDDANIYHRGSAIWIHWIVAWGYILIPTVATLYSLFKEKDKNKRKQIIPLVFFAFFPVVASIIQIFIPDASLIQVGMVLSAIIVFIKVQDNHVFTDTLTGLYNRSYFDKYLKEKVKLIDEDTPLFLLMMDVDDLKGINVLMGREKGDEILKQLGYIIFETSQKYSKTTTSRYEGDEFAMFGYGYELDEIKKIKEELENKVHSLNMNSTFSIDVSIGFIKGTKNSFMNIDQLIDLADIEMHKAYDDKKA
jgi:diguanylate cyclase (GGDEF)-like protein